MLNIIFKNLINALSYGAKSYGFYKLCEYCINIKKINEKNNKFEITNNNPDIEEKEEIISNISNNNKNDENMNYNYNFNPDIEEKEEIISNISNNASIQKCHSYLYESFSEKSS